MRYHPWSGTRYTSGTTPTSYQYTGQRNDAAIGLYFYNAHRRRCVRPLLRRRRRRRFALGRFIQADTIVPSPANPQSLNRYSYTINNPLKYVDPTGHAYDPFGGMNGGGSAVAGAAVIKIFEALSADGNPTNEVVAIAQAVSADGDPINEVQAVVNTVNTLCGGDCSDEVQRGMQTLERAANNQKLWQPFRLGAQAQLDRARYWLSTGRLVNIEQTIANGRLDLTLTTNNQAVEVKYWTNTYALRNIQALGDQLLKYQNAGYNFSTVH